MTAAASSKPDALDGTAAATPSTASSGFTFPREYHFPPFFTRQTNLTTLHAQQATWASLVLAYARHHRIFKLQLSAAADSDLFYNRALDRRLGMADIREVVEFMRKDGRAEYVSGGTVAAQGQGAAGTNDVVYVYWNTPTEWAAIVEAYVDETAQKGSVLTLYELTEGDGTRGSGTFPSILFVGTTTTDGFSLTTCATCRHSRNGQPGSAQGAQCPRQTRQGANLWTRRLSWCQVLLMPSTPSSKHIHQPR
jgi:ESCRT-II complex subunit VPS25